ncbi:hypothetical protein MRS44_014362 [Fusarium solani]|uniref:uncharacterized protein n=1 Tax=Fusarium solani TaxID=169388 RepID=UPI0032C3E580|nr:hypothetical protein MRS44_014362 [Fusarium solani]
MSDKSFSNNGVGLHPRPKRFRAPSWSWAAIDGDPSRITTINESFSLEVLERRTELESSAAPYGAVKGGHLVVRGRLRRVVLSGIKGRVYAPVGKSEPKLANLFHIVEPGWEGAEAWILMSFDAVEQEFQDNTDMDIAMLEEFRPSALPTGSSSTLSWVTGRFWLNYAARKSWAFDTIFWKYLDERFFGEREKDIPKEALWKDSVHLLSEEERAAMGTPSSG